LPLLYDDRGLVHCGRSYWQMWAQFAQIATPDEAHGHHFAHAMTALEAAVDEMGVVVSAPMLALPELQSGRLVEVMKNHPVPTFWMKAQVPRIKMNKPAVSQLVEYLKGRMQPAPPWELPVA